MLIFHNPGEIDIRGACIAGLSKKETDNAIGYFGTGLKYSIACILRWGGTITIYSGSTRYDFVSDPINYRGTEFHQIIMSSETGRDRLGFTTEYGKNWQPWQVFRELYANARDEGGIVELNTHQSQIGEGWTHIIVNCPELVECYYKRDEIILPENKLFTHKSAHIQFGPQQTTGIYYRGVRVQEQSAFYTWNFLCQLHLTEDRTLASSMQPSSFFDQFLVEHLHDVDIVMKLLSTKYDDSEARLARVVERNGQPHTLNERVIEATWMDWFYMPTNVCDWHSPEFREACVRLYQRDPVTFTKLRSYVKSIDQKLIEEKLYIMTPREQQMFDKAKELVALFGFNEEIARVPIHVQELGGQTLGLYEHGTIYLSPKLFDQGTKQLVATLYEECYHYRTQNEDCTYNMQSDLFNIIISLNEELHKVIC